MKTSKLIQRIGKLLRREPADVKRGKLRQTIKALKEKQKTLESRLKDVEGSHARRRLQQKIDVLEAQRKKGAQLYKQLKVDGG